MPDGWMCDRYVSRSSGAVGSFPTLEEILYDLEKLGKMNDSIGSLAHRIVFEAPERIDGELTVELSRVARTCEDAEVRRRGEMIALWLRRYELHRTRGQDRA